MTEHLTVINIVRKSQASWCKNNHIHSLRQSSRSCTWVLLYLFKAILFKPEKISDQRNNISHMLNLNSNLGTTCSFSTHQVKPWRPPNTANAALVICSIAELEHSISSAYTLKQPTNLSPEVAPNHFPEHCLRAPNTPTHIQTPKKCYLLSSPE